MTIYSRKEILIQSNPIRVCIYRYITFIKKLINYPYLSYFIRGLLKFNFVLFFLYHVFYVLGFFKSNVAYLSNVHILKNIIIPCNRFFVGESMATRITKNVRENPRPSSNSFTHLHSPPSSRSFPFLLLLLLFTAIFRHYKYPSTTPSQTNKQTNKTSPLQTIQKNLNHSDQF